MTFFVGREGLPYIKWGPAGNLVNLSTRDPILLALIESLLGMVRSIVLAVLEFVVRWWMAVVLKIKVQVCVAHETGCLDGGT